jgi:hypothetical protein
LTAPTREARHRCPILHNFSIFDFPMRCLIHDGDIQIHQFSGAGA